MNLLRRRSDATSSTSVDSDTAETLRLSNADIKVPFVSQESAAAAAATAAAWAASATSQGSHKSFMRFLLQDIAGSAFFLLLSLTHIDSDGSLELLACL